MKRFLTLLPLVFAAAALADEPVTRPLGETELQTLLTETLQRDFVKDRGELELRFTRSWPAITVPDEPVTLRILNLPNAGVTPTCIVRFELVTPSRTLGTWQMPVTARVWADVWVARAPLRRGQPLPEADRVQERRDVLTLREATLTGLADESLWEIAEAVPAGTPLTSRHLKLRTLVRRGQVAEAIVRDPALAISLKVEVLEDGVLGQQVRVRNLQSKREFRGKVVDEKTVTISL